MFIIPPLFGQSSCGDGIIIKRFQKDKILTHLAIYFNFFGFSHFVEEVVCIYK